MTSTACSTRWLRWVFRSSGPGPQGATIVHGAAGAFPIKRASLSLGNAGTAFRPLTAALAFSRRQLPALRRTTHA